MKDRVDILLHRRGLADSREMARRLILAGEVQVDGRLVDKPGTRVPVDADFKVKKRPPYVGRGGLKLEAALNEFPIRVESVVAADVGASTGGFTDCLLQRGAQRVYAIDVGYGQIDWKLRQDERVVVMERTNARYLESLPELVRLVVADVSFISLKLVLPAGRGWMPSGEGDMVALIKPQFEAGRRQVGKGGVVRDPEVHRAVLTDMLSWASAENFAPQGLIQSPVRGPAGNIEFLVWLQPGRTSLAVDALIEKIEFSLD